MFRPLIYRTPQDFTLSVPRSWNPAVRFILYGEPLLDIAKAWKFSKFFRHSRVWSRKPTQTHIYRDFIVLFLVNQLENNFTGPPIHIAAFHAHQQRGRNQNVFASMPLPCHVSFIFPHFCVFICSKWFLVFYNPQKCYEVLLKRWDFFKETRTTTNFEKTFEIPQP